jgi:hypothetical protein
MKKIPDLATRIFFAWYAVFIHLESPIVYKCSARVCYCSTSVPRVQCTFSSVELQYMYVLHVHTCTIHVK